MCNLHSKKGNKRYNLTSRFLLPSIYLSSTQFPITVLELLGFVDSYLEDDNKSIDNCLLLIFQPSKEIYEGEKWTYFIAMITKNNGLIEIVEYDLENRIFGFWMKMHEKFQNKLIFAFRRGMYSSFPSDYIQFLSEKEKKICKLDKNYKKELSLYLNVDEKYLMELESIPSNYDYKFTLKNTL